MEAEGHPLSISRPGFPIRAAKSRNATVAIVVSQDVKFNPLSHRWFYTRKARLDELELFTPCAFFSYTLALCPFVCLFVCLSLFCSPKERPSRPTKRSSLFCAKAKDVSS